MSQPAYSTRIHSIGDAILGLELGLRNLPGLLRSSSVMIPFVVIITVLDFAFASVLPPYYAAATRSQLDWWLIAFISRPFTTVMMFGMLHCLWFQTRVTIMLLLAAPLSLYGLGIIVQSLYWLTMRLSEAVKFRVVQSYAEQYDHPSLTTDLSVVTAFDSMLVLAIGAITGGLGAALALGGQLHREGSRVGAFAFGGLAILAILCAFVLSNGQFLFPDDAPASVELLLAVNAAVLLAASALLAVIIRSAWLDTEGRNLLRRCGWRLPALLLMASALANTAILPLDSAAYHFGIIKLRVDDVYPVAEFVCRDFVYQSYYTVMDVVFNIVLFSVTAQGFRRALGSELARFNLNST